MNRLVVRRSALPGAVQKIAGLDEVLATPGARGCSTWAAAPGGRRSRWPAPIRRRSVEGVGIDPPSIDLARANADVPSVTFRTAERRRAAGRPPTTRCSRSSASAACPAPVEGPRGRAPRGEAGGQVIVMDEAVADAFRPPRAATWNACMCGFSLFVCLPDGRAHPLGPATGTVMRPDPLRRYAREAGFTGGRDPADRRLRVLALLPAHSIVRRSSDYHRRMTAKSWNTPRPRRSGSKRCCTHWPIRPRLEIVRFLAASRHGGALFGHRPGRRQVDHDPPLPRAARGRGDHPGLPGHGEAQRPAPRRPRPAVPRAARQRRQRGDRRGAGAPRRYCAGQLGRRPDRPARGRAAAPGRGRPRRPGRWRRSARPAPAR